MVSLLIGAFFGGQQASLLPTKAVSFPNLKDATGHAIQIPSPSSKATLLFIVAVDCPIANRLAPEIARITKEYEKKSVQTFLIYPDVSRKNQEITKHIRQFGLSAPGFIDLKHLVVKASGASVTPQAILIDPKGFVRYLGRINDTFEEHGKTNAKPKTKDLRDALDQFLAGKPIVNPITQAVGCFINP